MDYEQGRKALEPESPDSPAVEEEPSDGLIVLSAKSGGSFLSREFWADLDVGHCWVDIKKPGTKQQDSWGFTATDVSNFPKYQPWTNVGGRVLHPDGSRGATGTYALPINQTQLAKGEAWAKAQSGKPYNLFSMNGGLSCASFAEGMFEATTGQSAPSGALGALIANPNSMSAAINKRIEADKAEQAEDGAEEVAG